MTPEEPTPLSAEEIAHCRPFTDDELALIRETPRASGRAAEAIIRSLLATLDREREFSAAAYSVATGPFAETEVAARATVPAGPDLVAVRRYSGGVLPDGTTTVPAVDDRERLHAIVVAIWGKCQHAEDYASDCQTLGAALAGESCEAHAAVPAVDDRERHDIERRARLQDALDALQTAVLWVNGSWPQPSEQAAESWRRKARSGIVALRAGVSTGAATPEPDRLREALDFIADWAHDCADPEDTASGYGFATIEKMARAALAPVETPR